MELILRATKVREHINAMVYALPGGGKTYFLLSTYEESGTERRGPVIFDTDKGGVDDTALDMDLTGKVPIFPVDDGELEKLFYAVAYPEEIVEIVNKSKKFKDYQVTCFGFDTLSSGAEIILGNPSLSLDELVSLEDRQEMITKSILSAGAMSHKRKRDHGAPALGDYKEAHNKMRLWLRKAREIPYHVVITCHAGIEEGPEDKGKTGDAEKTWKGYPLLPGKLRYDAAKLVDHFFYMEQTPSGQFRTHTRPRGIWNARTRIRKSLDPSITNFTFPQLVEIYEKAKAKGEVDDAS